MYSRPGFCHAATSFNRQKITKMVPRFRASNWSYSRQFLCLKESFFNLVSKHFKLKTAGFISQADGVNMQKYSSQNMVCQMFDFNLRTSYNLRQKLVKTNITNHATRLGVGSALLWSIISSSAGFVYCAEMKSPDGSTGSVDKTQEAQVYKHRSSKYNNRHKVPISVMSV